MGTRSVFNLIRGLLCCHDPAETCTIAPRWIARHVKNWQTSENIKTKGSRTWNFQIMRRSFAKSKYCGHLTSIFKYNKQNEGFIHKIKEKKAKIRF